MANTILHRLATLLAFCVSVNCVMIKPNVKNMLAPNHKETPDKIHSLTLRSPLYRSIRRIKAILKLKIKS